MYVVCDCGTELVESLDTRVVRHAICGLEHSVALTDVGQVFTWGSNKHGQLGRGQLDPQATRLPRLVSGCISVYWQDKWKCTCDSWRTGRNGFLQRPLAVMFIMFYLCSDVLRHHFASAVCTWSYNNTSYSHYKDFRMKKANCVCKFIIYLHAHGAESLSALDLLVIRSKSRNKLCSTLVEIFTMT